jgi:hypothetical protein
MFEAHTTCSIQWLKRALMGAVIGLQSGVSVENYSNQCTQGVEFLEHDGGSCLLLDPLHASSNCLMRVRPGSNLLAADALALIGIAPVDRDMNCEESVAPIKTQVPSDILLGWVEVDCSSCDDG